MAWSIAQVAAMSKVTSRTLRHYAAIGLLPPAWVADNGRRYYEQEQLLTLQQILVLRELGLGLDAIGRVLGGTHDKLDALRGHHRRLLAERDRFDQLARTVATTISQLEGGRPVSKESAELWFDGLHDKKALAELEREATERWGTRATEASQRVRDWTADTWAAKQDEWAEILDALVALIDAGTPADDPRALAVIERHVRWLTAFWTPNRASYTGFAQFYADDPSFRAKFDQQDGRLADYLRAAMTAYAEQRMN